MASTPMASTHEDFTPRIHPAGPSDRNFGLVFTGAFLIFGLWPLVHGRSLRLWCLAVSGAFLLITTIRPVLLHSLNRMWTRCGILMGKIVNPVVTGLLFYLVFTPVAVVLRWLGKDLLDLARDPGAATYWSPRSQAGDESSMTNQF
jgi:hypothetical protein